MAKWLAVFAANAHGRKWPVTSLVAEPKFGRDRVDSGHRTTTANRSLVTDAVEKVFLGGPTNFLRGAGAMVLK
jgi:hypothetical protein